MALDTTTERPLDPTESKETPAGRPETSGEIDFFGTGLDNTYEIAMPGDTTQVIICKILTEGDRKRYQNEMNRGVQVDKKGNANLSMAPGDERWRLIQYSVVDWTLRKGGKPYPWSEHRLKEFLNAANPKIVDHIEKEIRTHNPWMLGDMPLEDLYRERDQLNDLIEAKEKEEAGN